MDKLLGKLAPHFIKNGFEKVMSDEDGDLLYVQKRDLRKSLWFRSR